MSDAHYCNCYDPWNCKEQPAGVMCRSWTAREKENAERADAAEAANLGLSVRRDEYDRAIELLVDAQEQRDAIQSKLEQADSLLRRVEQWFAQNQERLREHGIGGFRFDDASVVETSAHHVCGLEGYNGMIDPPCPGCERKTSNQCE